MCSAKVANHVTNCGDPWHDEERIKQTRPHETRGVRQVVPPKVSAAQRESAILNSALAAAVEKVIIMIIIIIMIMIIIIIIMIVIIMIVIMKQLMKIMKIVIMMIIIIIIVVILLMMITILGPRPGHRAAGPEAWARRGELPIPGSRRGGRAGQKSFKT